MAAPEHAGPPTWFHGDLSYLNVLATDGRVSGVIDWGTNNWYLSGPWQQFTTNSVGFNGPGSTAKTFILINPQAWLATYQFHGSRPPNIDSIWGLKFAWAFGAT